MLLEIPYVSFRSAKYWHFQRKISRINAYKPPPQQEKNLLKSKRRFFMEAANKPSSVRCKMYHFSKMSRSKSKIWAWNFTASIIKKTIRETTVIHRKYYMQEHWILKMNRSSSSVKYVDFVDGYQFQKRRFWMEVEN